MTSEKRERDPFLAAIEAKIAAWKAVADSYLAAVSIDGQLGEISGNPPAAAVQQHRAPAAPGRPMDLPVGVFRDKSIKEAITIYLGAGHRKQTNKEITIGLQKGGIATTSANFEATVATALHRMKEEGTILRFPDGWDLAASYPDNLRGRLEKEGKPRRVKKGKAKARRTAAKSAGVTAKTVYIKMDRGKPVPPAQADTDREAAG